MKSFGIALVAALALVIGVSAQQAPAKPDQKPADAPKTLAGKWDMTVALDQGPLAVVAGVKQDGTKLTGTLSSSMNPNPNPLTGEVAADGKVKFSIQFDGGNGAMEIVFTGAMKADGTLAGTMSSSQMGDVTWTATRQKGL